jgi:hypothetical protein
LLGGGRHLPRVAEKGLAIGCQHITRATPLEQRQADRFLQRGDTPGDRRLAHTQRAPGLERTALLGHGDEVAKVVPVKHSAPCPISSEPAFCIIAERFDNIVSHIRCEKGLDEGSRRIFRTF